jgi:hypothetical protein
MKMFSIFKKPKKTPYIEKVVVDEWEQKNFEKNVAQGIQSLKDGRSVNIMDNGRGYELALAIKNGYILEYQKFLAQQIKISGGSTITIERVFKSE